MPSQRSFLVTGASRGIGAEIAVALSTSEPGSRVFLVARSEDGLTQTAQRCAPRADVEVCVADLGSTADVSRLRDKVLAKTSSLDALINNAGGWKGGLIDAIDPDLFDQVLSMNLRTAFLTTHAFVPAMKAAGKGDIVFISSTSGLEGLPQNTAYCAAKFGVRGLAAALREELRSSGVRVSCIFPGQTDTSTWDGVPIRRERMIPPQDIANAVALICSSSSNTLIEELVIRPTTNPWG